MLAHPECNGLPHKTLVWPCSRSTAERYARIGPWHKCTDITDELELAHSGLKSLIQNPRMGPLPAP